MRQETVSDNFYLILLIFNTRNGKSVLNSSLPNDTNNLYIINAKTIPKGTGKRRRKLVKRVIRYTSCYCLRQIGRERIDDPFARNKRLDRQ